MTNKDPRRRNLRQNLMWFVATLIVLIVLLRIFSYPVILAALWVVGLAWGGFLAYKFSQILFGSKEAAVGEAWAKSALSQASDYRAKIKSALDNASGVVGMRPEELEPQIDSLVRAVEALVDRISNLRQNKTICRDMESVPKSITELESRLLSESDQSVKKQLQRTLNNRRKQLESLETLQNTIRRSEIQIESTLSQLGTIYSQLLTGQSTSHVADYSRLSADVDEEVRLLQDQLEALREVKLGGV